ncbi:MAG: hypothetical protein N0C84_00960 [Candidatus Thiodiazotropha taylori]|uniref:Uncharacterized protein n=1 Tax=Candidatus Thiodiazotropha taylori TaxID=2792791 RepID=A0A9E4K9D4_9GAMM|nr:hypothetical protein [Candidatus Thiodiazotropha taylori]MCW4255015.1 hypothetical protein [Candidatus Thiodiazotropha taylori]
MPVTLPDTATDGDIVVMGGIRYIWRTNRWVGMHSPFLENDAINGNMITDDAINGDHIADNSIGSGEIIDGSITGNDIANNAITLGTHTQGNYVATIAPGNDITVTGSGGETAAVTVAHGNTSNLNGWLNTDDNDEYIDNLQVDDNGHVTGVVWKEVSAGGGSYGCWQSSDTASLRVSNNHATDNVTIPAGATLALCSWTSTFSARRNASVAVHANNTTLQTVTNSSGGESGSGSGGILVCLGNMSTTLTGTSGAIRNTPVTSLGIRTTGTGSERGNLSVNLTVYFNA